MVCVSVCEGSVGQYTVSHRARGNTKVRILREIQYLLLILKRDLEIYALRCVVFIGIFIVVWICGQQENAVGI